MRTLRPDNPSLATGTGGRRPGGSGARSLQAQRIELIAAPTALLDALDGEALRSALSSTLPSTDTVIETMCGAYRVTAVATNARRSDPNKDGAFEIVEGWWPEPVGVRIACPGPEHESVDSQRGIEIEADHLGLRPIFHARTGRGEIIAATQPALLAALVGSRMSAASFSQALLVGYLLNDCSIFEHIHRLRPGEMIRIAGDGSSDIAAAPDRTTTTHASRAELIARVADRVATSFEQGDALELSGGMDSRLVLAMGLSRGVRPRLAFTIGEPGDEDVAFARAICRKTGVEHRRLPTAASGDALESDGLRFVEQSGYTVDANAYAWLPSVFRRLSDDRDAQIGGGGGECAGGFYDSPLDGLARLPGGGLEWWIRRRLLIGGVRLSDLLETEAARGLESTVVRRAQRWFAARSHEPWRATTARFYREQRVPNAGGGVLSASACWYRPLQPLLGAAFQAWCDTLAPGERRGRATQRALLQTLAPDLAEIPLQGGRVVRRGGAAFAGRIRHIAAAQSEKAWRRALNRAKRPDLGAAEAANGLARRPRIERLIRELLTSHELPIRRTSDGTLIDPAAWDERSLGMLITFALARHRATALAADLRSTAMRQSSGRRAA
jgi:hypothetical protein